MSKYKKSSKDLKKLLAEKKELKEKINARYTLYANTVKLAIVLGIGVSFILSLFFAFFLKEFFSLFYYTFWSIVIIGFFDEMKLIIQYEIILNKIEDEYGYIGESERWRIVFNG